MKHVTKEKDQSLFNFAYLLVYLIILGCATLAIPFYAQKYRSEEIQLKNQKLRCQTAIEERSKEIKNLKMRLLACQSEAIKQHAAALQLQKPLEGQLVQFDASLTPHVPVFGQTALAKAHDIPQTQKDKMPQ